ncbi:phytoene desaturase [Kineosporia sp. J2-2]|uniref:Phytoene desaturase n=1 Tax=Kineosporia corallincola TaxID=2835133 RepID=A0ABS5TIY8_9ACTN|nr:phytoene desaturase family protein [Kineosporia corallincola]MBT0771064.1 phytoene desaturase [Kineosporia corallincola]
MARVVVVGAGLGGLSAAARLGALGHQVTVLEQAGQIGGKLGLLRREGFGFDTGPSLLTLPAVYRDLFLKTGAPLDDVLELAPLDPACHYRFPGGLTLDVPNDGPTGVSRAWAQALGERAGQDWTAFHRRATQIWDLTRNPFLESPLDGARTLAGLARHPADVRTVAPWLSLRGLGRKYLSAPEQRMFLDRYATYTGSDPRRAPAALATVPFVEHAFGSWYIPGGLWQLGAAIADRAVSHGVKIRTSAPVERVLAAPKVEGVRLESGETVPADVVVSGVEAAHLYRDLLPGPEGRGARRALRKASPSLSGFVMLLALRGRTPGLRHHTVLFPADYDAEFDHVFGTGPQAGKPSPVPDPTVYVSAPDDPALRPDDDHEAWFVLVNAPRHEPGTGLDWNAPGLAESYATKILAVMASRGLDVRERLLWKEIRTPADLERDTRSTGGAIYGSSSNGARSAFLRPANRSPVPGLFLVGGSSHPGGGLPLVGLSASIVTDMIGKA